MYVNAVDKDPGKEIENVLKRNVIDPVITFIIADAIIINNATII